LLCIPFLFLTYGTESRSSSSSSSSSPIFDFRNPTPVTRRNRLKGKNQKETDTMHLPFLLATLAAAAVSAEDVLPCGSATYFPSEYTCHGNSTLCPRVYGLATLPCSSSGCYSPQAFSCSADGSLKNLPKATSPFTLTAFGTRTTYFNQSVKACGGYLAIGANARECTSCRPGVGVSVDCAGYGRKTVLVPGGEMVSFFSPLHSARAGCVSWS